jgi:hypothetical protein
MVKSRASEGHAAERLSEKFLEHFIGLRSEVSSATRGAVGTPRPHKENLLRRWSAGQAKPRGSRSPTRGAASTTDLST